MGDDPSQVDDYLRDQSRKIDMSSGSYFEHYHAAPGERPPLERPRALPVIPRPPDLLVGRDRLQEAIHADLKAGRTVSLHGLPGIGKTALAATVACDRQARGEKVLWLEAGQRDWAAVYDDLGRAFGDQEMQRLDLDAKPAHARTLLAANGIRLVALDDVWDGAAARTFARAALPEGCVLMLTARERVGVGKACDVEALGEADSAALLRHHANWDDATDVKAVCDLLAGHPMALEVAGRMASTTASRRRRCMSAWPGPETSCAL